MAEANAASIQFSPNPQYSHHFTPLPIFQNNTARLTLWILSMVPSCTGPWVIMIQSLFANILKRSFKDNVPYLHCSNRDYLQFTGKNILKIFQAFLNMNITGWKSIIWNNLSHDVSDNLSLGLFTYANEIKWHPSLNINSIVLNMHLCKQPGITLVQLF